MSKKSEDIQRAELERKSRDLYKVYNPTNQDMRVTLNARISPEVWTIHSMKEEIVPWYVAEMYADKMYDQIIYSKSDQAVIDENAKRLAGGFPKMDIHTEQFRFESKNLKNFGAKKEKIMRILIVGLYKEYGVGEGTEVYNQEREKQRLETEAGVDEVLGTSPSLPTTTTSPLVSLPQNAPSEVGEADQTPTLAVPTMKELKKQAESLGIDTSKMKTKTEVEMAIKSSPATQPPLVPNP